MTSRKKAAAGGAEVVVVGSFNQDHIWCSAHFPQPGETRLGRFSGGPGGKGFNQSVAAARQGAKTCLIAAIGSDALGEGAQALAKNEGIDARWQLLSTESTGTAAILLDASGQNMIVVAPGANTSLSPAHVAAQADTIAAARVVVTQHEVHPAASRKAMELARAAGVTTVHNPAPVVEGADGLLALVDILTPNESEFAALVQRCGESVVAEQLVQCSDVELHRLCRLLQVPTVVLTLGRHGAFVSHAEHDRRKDADLAYRIAAESVTVVDTTGAGDAFTGALAAMLARSPDTPFVHAVLQANRVAGLAVESAGAALAMPRADDVKRRFG